MSIIPFFPQDPYLQPWFLDWVITLDPNQEKKIAAECKRTLEIAQKIFNDPLFHVTHVRRKCTWQDWKIQLQEERLQCTATPISFKNTSRNWVLLHWKQKKSDGWFFSNVPRDSGISPCITIEAFGYFEPIFNANAEDYLDPNTVIFEDRRGLQYILSRAHDATLLPIRLRRIWHPELEPIYLTTRLEPPFWPPLS